MAYLQQTSQPTPTQIDNFLGLNMNETGDTQLKLGESGHMKNFRITKDYKLTKMNGYKQIYSVDAPIRSQWIGKLGDKQVHIFVAGGKIYNKSDEIGEITDDITSIFEFNQKLYFLNGHEYKVWDGTELKEVEGYIPLVRITTAPDGQGTDFESINILSNKRHQTFSPDGEAKEFLLVETNVTSIDKVLVNGVELTTGITKDLENGKVTFEVAPVQAVDNIDIYWTKGELDKTLITKNYYFQKYGLANDTRVFIYGNQDAKNRIRFSALANGVPSVEYFPATNFIDIGSSNTAVTDINRQYDRLIISKEDETYYANYEEITDITGQTIITFPAYPLNSAHGMVAYAQGQLLDNYVTTIDTSIVMWTSTVTKDERNAEIISQRIQEWLNSKDLTKAITLDYQELKEYWLAIDNEIMIYNYGNSTFYLLEIPHTITNLICNDGKVVFGTKTGQIMSFEDELTSYNGEIIKAVWESGFYDFEIDYKRKTMRTLFFTLKPFVSTTLNVSYISDRDRSSESKEMSSYCYSYPYYNYPNFTHNINYNIKPFKIKLKAKKFAFLNILKNLLKQQKSLFFFYTFPP